jgi:hypothetical protein
MPVSDAFSQLPINFYRWPTLLAKVHCSAYLSILLSKMLSKVLHKREAIFWTLALLAIAMLPMNNLPSLCIAKTLGFAKCWGCGIGHSMQAAFRGDWTTSFALHPLGIIAIVVLIHRIITLLFKPNY